MIPWADIVAWRRQGSGQRRSGSGGCACSVVATPTMSETALFTLRRILALSVVLEIGTGVALMIAPAIVAALLVRGEITGLAIVLGRCMGVALLALALACWPERQGAAPGSAPFRAMFTYNALIALILGYVGAIAHFGGPLLWPAVALHGAMALLLAWKRRETRLNP